uniref:Uncharacterized protein LOC111134763 n=1 Tax=Crassostrea virginica TaxID=6565 RepID=A0A8B8EJY2_CRAVI|nr:uncharacterized protein LOC111134763 [Crassostrea virginica]
MVKLKCATSILAGVVTVLRLPSFFILEKWVLSTEGITWSQLPLKAYGFVLATLMLTLRQDHLFKLYWNLATEMLLLYLPSQYVLRKVLEPTLNGIQINDSAILTAFLLCTATGLLAVHLSEEKTWKAAAMMVNTLPVAAVCIGLTPYITHYIHGFTSTLILCYLSYRVSLSERGLIEEIYLWIHLVDVFGFYSVTKPIIDSIQQQLLVFWVATFAYSAAFTVKETDYLIWNMSWSDWITFLLTCVEECCRTPVGLMATSVVDYWSQVSLLPMPHLMPASHWKHFCMVSEKPVGTWTMLGA